MCFFFTAPAPTDIFTLSLHDALPILLPSAPQRAQAILSDAFPESWANCTRARFGSPGPGQPNLALEQFADRKSTRLNSSHVEISYAVLCLKKKIAGVEEETVAADGAV